MAGYRELFDASIEDARAFWGEAARAVTWTRAPQRILDDANPPFYRWFPDGELNTCANALDRHLEQGRGEQAALIYDSPLDGTTRTYTYRELLDETSRFAEVLRGLGVRKGDRVVIYMPMVPEAVIAMLAAPRVRAPRIRRTPPSARPAAARRDHGALRRKAGGHHRRGRVLEGGRRTRCEGAVLGADGHARHQEGGSGRHPPEPLRPVRAAVPLPSGRTAGPRHLPLGVGEAGHPRRRPLVADRDRMVDRSRADGHRGDDDQTRLGDRADARLRRARPSTRRDGVRGRRRGVDLRQTPAASGHPADPVGRQRSLRRVESVGVPRLLPVR